MDTFSKVVRSDIMRSVKSKGNKSTELALIELFKNYSIKGWRRNAKILGHPDFFFPKLKLAVFVDGCFWHGCICKNKWPKTNEKYWQNKIRKNRKRDIRVNQELRKSGYNVIRIRECQLKKGKLPKSISAIFRN